MAYFLVGLAVLVLLLVVARRFVATDPRKLAAVTRKAGGIAALAAGGFLILRGALPIAIPLVMFGLALMGRGSGFGFGGPFGSTRKTAGQKSHIKTDRLEMELDHDSGHMDGQYLAGRFAGRKLSTLSDREAIELFDELQQPGAPEAAVLEAYLNWRLPGWRGDDAGEEAQEEPRRGRARSNRMSAEEAYALLGIKRGASEEEIRQAHRRLMMKVHPDQGGSTYLAARINEAKEVLLGRG
jgi:hypothetical protein